MTNEEFMANPKRELTLNEAKQILKMTHVIVNKKIKSHFGNPVFFECPRNELEDYLDNAAFEGADIITKNGEITVAYYNDLVNCILYVVLTHFKKAFVMKLHFKK